MDKERFIEKLYKLFADENLNIYKELFSNTDMNKATDPYWKEALKLYNSLTNEHRVVLFKIIKQIEIDTVSNILGLLDGVCSLGGLDDDFYLSFEKSSEKLNGDLQDTFLEYDELNKSR